MDAETISVALIALICTCPVRGSDFSLPRVGPAPLRFAPIPPKLGSYVWPVAPKPVPAVTNAENAALVPAPTAPTNSLATTVSDASSSPFATQTNSAPAVRVTDINPSNSQNLSQLPLGADGKPLSASNLLIVTPQMLADYFKATLDELSTNAPSGADIPFNPPIPKLPSSEAIYRTQ